MMAEFPEAPSPATRYPQQWQVARYVRVKPQGEYHVAHLQQEYLRGIYIIHPEKIKGDVSS